VIEAGSLVRPEELTELEGDMTARLYAESGMRTTDDLAITLLQGAAVGGGTLVNWMITFRTPDFVLDEWASRFGLHDFAPATMAPAFDCVAREIHATLVPDDAHSPANRILLDGAARLGWRAGAGRINARSCLRTGFCGQGCRYGAKQGVDQVYIPRAVAAGARLLADARVDRIEVVERDGASSGAARGSRRSTPPLKRVHVTLTDRRTRAPVGGLVAEAPVVVLAAGAISTPVLLQRSDFGGGGVGRYLRLHPTTAVAGEHGADVYAAGGVPQSAVCDEFLRRDDHGYGFWIECAPNHPALGAVAAPGFGEAHRDIMRRFRRTTNLITLVRDGSDLDASNGSVGVSASGRVRIAYRVGARDRENLIAGVQAAARILLAAGVSDVRTLHVVGGSLRDERDVMALRHRGWRPHDLTLFSAHVNGTCRLGTDPRTSGADPGGERHGARGLYVADGSLLPTGLGVNPQLTIMAIATVIAQRMVESGGV
jgi:choline dehydrogenase-like flavoprotein